MGAHEHEIADYSEEWRAVLPADAGSGVLEADVALLRAAAEAARFDSSGTESGTLELRGRDETVDALVATA